MKLRLYSNKCPSCNAPVKRNAEKCEFCGMIFTKTKDGQIIQEIKDFGIKGNFFPITIIIGIIFIDILGWIYGQSKYNYIEGHIDWFTEVALLLWTGALPIWILVTTIIWSNKWGAILYGIIISVIMFIAHLFVLTAYQNWHFSDDNAGLAGLAAGSVLASWLIGRLIHNLIRKSRNKKLY